MEGQCRLGHWRFFVSEKTCGSPINAEAPPQNAEGPFVQVFIRPL